MITIESNVKSNLIGQKHRVDQSHTILHLGAGHRKALHEFEYSDGDIGDLITACVYNLSFMGLTGGLSFDTTGEPLKNIKIEQIQGKRLAFSIL